MTFEEFQRVNEIRARKAFPAQCMTAEFLVIAIGGEFGEMANFFKKYLRGDNILSYQMHNEMAKELADIITYCDLLMTVLGHKTGEEVASKWNEVSIRRGYSERLNGLAKETEPAK